MAQPEHLSETCMERLEQAERVGPKRQTTIECVSGYVRQQVRPLDWAPTASYALHASLIPSYYLDRGASMRTVTAGEPRRALAECRRTRLCEPGGALGTWSPMAPSQLKDKAKTRAEGLQRSSAHVAGRHGYLALRPHQLRGLDHPRKRAWLTAMPNFSSHVLTGRRRSAASVRNLGRGWPRFWKRSTYRQPLSVHRSEPWRRLGS
jgi:hypothetical protein